MTQSTVPQFLPSRQFSLTASLVVGSEIVQQAFGWIPPTGLVLLSCFAIQTATAGAKSLFETVGVIGTAFVCKGIAAVMLLCMERSRIKETFKTSHSFQDYALVVGLGVAIALGVMAIYAAIARIPMGIASTLEFIGPLGVAVLGSARLLHLFWVALAGIGVFLLNPLGYAALDGTGVGLALIAAIGWAGYIVLSSKVGQVFPGKVGLALAMTIATLIMLPFGISHLIEAITPTTILIGFSVASLGTLLPYSLEYTALKQMPNRIFGTLMSIEPAIAAVVGFIFLHEVLSLKTIVALVLVTIAAAGSSLTESNDDAS